MRKTILLVLILVIAAGGGYAYYAYTKKDEPPTVSTAKVTRGDIVDTVGATGQLQAVTTVQVGTQVSGTVQQLCGHGVKAWGDLAVEALAGAWPVTADTLDFSGAALNVVSL